LLPNDTFSIGAVASLADSSDPSDSFLASPGDAASDKISTTVARVVDELKNTIRTEAIISTIILLVWIFVVFLAIARALMLWRQQGKVRGEGGAPNLTPGNDFRSDHQDRYAGFVDIPLTNMNKDRPMSPAPEYTPAEKSGMPEDDYQDTKLGFTGYGSQQIDRKNPFS